MCFIFVAECSRLWASATSEWFQQMIDDGTLFNAYCYFPPKAAYVLPHNIDKDVLACDLYIHDRDQKEIKLWSVSYIRPPIESHVAFMMIIQNMACHCAFFNSELNRKKAQRAIKEAKEKAQSMFYVIGYKFRNYYRISSFKLQLTL